MTRNPNNLRPTIQLHVTLGRMFVTCCVSMMFQVKQDNTVLFDHSIFRFTGFVVLVLRCSFSSKLGDCLWENVAEMTTFLSKVGNKPEVNAITICIFLAFLQQNEK